MQESAQSMLFVSLRTAGELKRRASCQARSLKGIEHIANIQLSSVLFAGRTKRQVFKEAAHAHHATYAH